MNRRLMVTLLMTLATRPVMAENASFVIPFGSEPGAPLAHAYDYGVVPNTETYTMRVPSVDPEMLAIVADIELTITAATKIVQRAYAARAYRAYGECTQAQDILRTKLQKALPQPYSGVSEAWQFQSADGRVVGGTYCQQARHLPFPILILELTVAPTP